MIGARLDQSVIALIGGFVIGCLIAAPIAAMIMCLMMRRREAAAVPKYHVTPQQQSAPQFVVLPPMYGGPALQAASILPRRELAEPFSLPMKRRFYLIGEDGQATEIQPDDSLSAEEASHVR